MRINPSTLKVLLDACEDYKKINAFGICPRMYGMFTDTDDAHGMFTDTDKNIISILSFRKFNVYFVVIYHQMCF